MDAAGRAAKTYSGGMRRRLDLAASLVGRPDVLFLDEPTTGLDPRSRIDVWDFIRELKDEGTTLLLTTQYLEEADQLADRIAVIDVGSVIALGTSDELKDQIGGEVVELHVQDRADLGRVVEALAGVGAGEPGVDEDDARDPDPGRERRFGRPVGDGPPAGRHGDRARRHRPASPVVGRRLPVAHRARGGAARRRRRAPRTARSAAASASGPRRRATHEHHHRRIATSSAGRRQGIPARVRQSIRDSLLVARRNVVTLTRVPAVFVFELVQPIMFVLLFVFIYANQLATLPPGMDYVQFLMPGIFIQNALFGSTNTAIGLAEDFKTGVIDRFRSLPMARSAVVAGRTTSDVIKNGLLLTIVIGVGYLVGFRFQNGFLNAIGMYVLVLAVGFTFSWISACIGLSLKQVEAVQAASSRGSSPWCS